MTVEERLNFLDRRSIFLAMLSPLAGRVAGLCEQAISIAIVLLD